MSTEYMFVEKKRKEEVRELWELMTTEREAAKAKLEEFVKAHPGLENEIEDLVYRITKAYSTYCVDAEREEQIIGTATTSRFYWRVDNGFRDAASVQAYAEAHPECVIENEYGSALTLDEFLERIKY